MAFNAEAVARLKLDSTEFERGLSRTVADVGDAGKDMHRKLQRAFGAGDMLKGLMQGLGIGSAESIVALIAKPFEAAAESAKSIAESTAKTLGLYQQIFSSRRTDQQNLAANLKEQARTRKEMEDANKTETTTTKNWNPFTQRFDESQKVTKEADPEKAARLGERLAELAKEEYDLKNKIAESSKKRFEEETKAAELATKNAKELSDMERESEAKKLTLAEKLYQLEYDRDRLRREEQYDGEENFERSKRILELEGKIADAKKEQATQQDKIAQAEKKVEQAGESLAGAHRKRAEQFEDRSGLTVGEIAAGAKGASQTTRARAREIQRLESQAKRQRASGFDDAASASTDRALSLRKKMGALTGGERDPMASANEAIVKSEEHLAQIRKDLEIAKVAK